jgi:cytosine/creatinine deaminase
MNHSDPEPPKLILRRSRVVLGANTRPEECEIAIGHDGRIFGIAPSIKTGPPTQVVDLGRRLVVPGLIDVHQHLDKTRTRDAAPNPDGTLVGAVRAFNTYAQIVSVDDIVHRAEATVNACVARGTTAIRTHVNVGPASGLKGLEAISMLRERTADRVRLQVVALIPPDGNSARQWISEAVALGIDAIGGAPAHADDSETFLTAIFDEAERHGLDVDLHLDEHLDHARHFFHQLADMTIARGMQGRVLAGHCSALGALSLSQAQPICDAFANAGIGVIALPAANLYLLGRDFGALSPRGITRVHSLARAGVNVACGSDNIQDAFVPTGTGDLLELARWTMLAGHFHDFASAFNMVTAAPARMMRLTDHGIRVGARADLLITSAEDVADLVASGPLDRAVLYGGGCVAGCLSLQKGCENGGCALSTDS